MFFIFPKINLFNYNNKRLKKLNKLEKLRKFICSLSDFNIRYLNNDLTFPSVMVIFFKINEILITAFCFISLINGEFTL